MKLLLQLSFRNLFRHKRRNAMLLLAIAVAVGGVNATNTLLPSGLTAGEDLTSPPV